MADRIPELRLYDVDVDSTCDSFAINPDGAAPRAVATVTQSSALPVNPGDPSVWTTLLTLGYGASTYGAADVKEAGTTAGWTAPTITYNSSGTNRGKWTFADTVNFAMDDNSKDLLALFGFTQSSYASAASHTSDYPTPYIFTPAHGLKDAEDFTWSQGWSWDTRERGVVQAITDEGAVYTEVSPAIWYTRIITFTLLADADIWWLEDFWALASTGRMVRFFQDRTEGNAYSKAYPYGYLNCALDEASIKGLKITRTFPGRPGLYDATFKIRKWV